MYFYKCTYPCNYCHSQDIAYFYNPQTLHMPLCSRWLLLPKFLASTGVISIQIILPFPWYHTNGIVLHVVFPTWLLWPSIKIWNAPRYVCQKFLCCYHEVEFQWMTIPQLFIHSSVGGHLDCSQFQAIINKGFHFKIKKISLALS